MSSHLFRSKAANGIMRRNPPVSTLTFAVDVVCLGACGVVSPGLVPGLLGVTGGCSMEDVWRPGPAGAKVGARAPLKET
jgi:hypothetical protein